MSDDYGLLELERNECLALLGSVPVGRFVHTAHALPAIWPVNFLLLADAIYLRTSHGSGPWRAAAANAVIAFETDDIDAEHRCGWSVVVIGRAGLVHEDVALRRLRQVVPPPWASSDREELVRIPLALIDGRRVGARITAARSATPAG